jgi:penicillin-binding protein 1C
MNMNLLSSPRSSRLPSLGGWLRGIGRSLKRPWIAVLAGLGLILMVVFWFCLPEPLFDEPYSSVLLGRDGSLLGARAAADGHWRFPEGAAVPRKFEQALIRFEDKRFHSHPGVDPIGWPGRCASI